MKRFLLFAGESFYPSGGWHDFIADFDSLNEAYEFMQNYKVGLYVNNDGTWITGRLLDIDGFAHVVDTDSQETIDIFVQEYRKTT